MVFVMSEFKHFVVCPSSVNQRCLPLVLCTCDLIPGKMVMSEFLFQIKDHYLLNTAA